MSGTLLEEAIEAWIDAREGVIAELENIPEERLGFRPVDGVRSVQELIHHIVEVSLLMVGELTRSDGDFRRAPFPELLAEYSEGAQPIASKSDLIELLRSTLTDGVAAFRQAGELHMLGAIRRFDGKYGTRFDWMHHGISQEMYHRGQLALYQRLMGLEPALTKRIRGG